MTVAVRMQSPPDPDAEIKYRLQNAIVQLERITKMLGGLDPLDVLVAIGAAEHELEIAKSLARHALRTNPY